MSPLHPASRAAMQIARQAAPARGAEAIEGLGPTLRFLFTARNTGEALLLDACGAEAKRLFHGAEGDLLARFARADAAALRLALHGAARTHAVLALVRCAALELRIELCLAPLPAPSAHTPPALVGAAGPLVLQRKPGPGSRRGFPLRLITLGLAQARPRLLRVR